MFALLSPRLWIAIAVAAALAFSHFAIYRKGRHDVQQAWAVSIAAGNEEARRLERARQSKADDAARVAATREAGIRADADRARGAVGGLRSAIESAQRRGEESAAAALQSARVLGDVLQSCTAEYQRVAEEADRATSEALTLRQSWPTDTP